MVEFAPLLLIFEHHIPVPLEGPDHIGGVKRSGPLDGFPK